MFLIEIAKRFKKGEIYMGSNQDDIFPDNKRKFLEKAIKVINISFNTNLRIRLPLEHKTKKNIMEYINKHKINTYSCYNGGEIPCGECKACKSVLNATNDSKIKK